MLTTPPEDAEGKALTSAAPGVRCSLSITKRTSAASETSEVLIPLLLLSPIAVILYGMTAFAPRITRISASVRAVGAWRTFSGFTLNN